MLNYFGCTNSAFALHCILALEDQKEIYPCIAFNYAKLLAGESRILKSNLNNTHVIPSKANSEHTR